MALPNTLVVIGSGRSFGGAELRETADAVAIQAVDGRLPAAHPPGWAPRQLRRGPGALDQVPGGHVRATVLELPRHNPPRRSRPATQRRWRHYSPTAAAWTWPSPAVGCANEVVRRHGRGCGPLGCGLMLAAVAP